MERDDDLRAACFLALDALRAQLGDELPYAGALQHGFAFRGERVPFLNYQKGIYRAAAQRGPAALSINTSFRSPYDDAEAAGGYLYAYRAGSVDQPDNRALRAAFELGVPLVYFVGTYPGKYRPLYPWYVEDDRLNERRVLVTPGHLDRTLPEPAAVRLEDELSRRYVFRETRLRLHQDRFRGLVLPAYHERCAVCRLREVRLLDAAHIVPDADPAGSAAVTNGLSLCTIHHRAFDRNLVGITPDYEVRVARQLLEDEDGPMLDLLKGFHRAPIELPRPAARPDRERLAVRFERFRELAGS
ncbi:MAG: HNH endonuclease [Thermoleophilia bacterium]|nr:HNH endonuclease [Thermoleophilia bacterium]